MTHGLVMEVPAPADFYDALHTEIGRRSAGRADGMLLHVGRVTGDVSIFDSEGPVTVEIRRPD